ncbi:MAG: hypothetical protein V3V96_06605 [Acidiferrobacterales bacterium]
MTTRPQYDNDRHLIAISDRSAQRLGLQAIKAGWCEDYAIVETERREGDSQVSKGYRGATFVRGISTGWLHENDDEALERAAA